jgi:hypothetical protein
MIKMRIYDNVSSCHTELPHQFPKQGFLETARAYPTNLTGRKEAGKTCLIIGAVIAIEVCEKQLQSLPTGIS